MRVIAKINALNVALNVEKSFDQKIEVRSQEVCPKAERLGIRNNAIWNTLSFIFLRNSH